MGNLNLKVMGMVTATALLLSPVANAQLSVKLTDDDANTVTVTDTLNTGTVSFVGALGAGDWVSNISAGLGAPILGSPFMDEFDFVSANASGGTGVLQVMLTQTNLTRADAQWATSFGGTTDGIVNFTSYVDNGNAAFAQTTDVTGTTFDFTNGSFANDDSGALGGFGLSDLYSWTIVASIIHGDNRNVTSFDYNVKIPEPSSLALLGLGLIGAGFASRRKSRKAA